MEPNDDICTKKGQVCDMDINKCVAKIVDVLEKDKEGSKALNKFKKAAKKAGKQAVAAEVAKSVGLTFVKALQKLKSSKGEHLIDPESIEPYGLWTRGKVANGYWKGELFAYNSETDEFIIYSQHVKQDKCEPCPWVLYPSVKYGTDKKKGFANVLGTLWYWNTIEEDWYEEVPDGVTFDQAELKKVQDKLYGKKKSSAPAPDPASAPAVTSSDKTPCKSKSCCKNKTCHADVEKCDKEGLVPCPKNARM